MSSHEKKDVDLDDGNSDGGKVVRLGEFKQKRDEGRIRSTLHMIGRYIDHIDYGKGAAEEVALVRKYLAPYLTSYCRKYPEEMPALRLSEADLEIMDAGGHIPLYAVKKMNDAIMSGSRRRRMRTIKDE